MERTKRWEEEIQHRLQEAELPVAPNVWSQIEKRLYPTHTKMGWWSRRRVQWTAVAALLAGVLAGGLLWMTHIPNLPEEHAARLATEQVTKNRPTEEQSADPTTAIETIETIEADRTSSVEPLLATTVRPAPSHTLTPAERQHPIGQQQPIEQQHSTEPTPSAPQPSDEIVGSADETSAATSTPPNEKNEPHRPQHPVHTLRSGGLIAQTNPVTKRSRRLSLAIYGGSGSGHRPAQSGGYILMQDQVFDPPVTPPISHESSLTAIELARKNYIGAEFEHQLPWSIGVTLRKELSDRCSIESGLTYTLLRSKVNYLAYSGSQALHLIGIPIRFGYTLVRGDRLSLYGGAGGSIERCLYAELDGVQASEARTYFSIGGLLGAEYHINPTLGLYIEPELTHTLSRTRLRSVLNDEPTHLKVRIGLRFTLR